MAGIITISDVSILHPGECAIELKMPLIVVIPAKINLQIIYEMMISMSIKVYTLHIDK